MFAAMHEVAHFSRGHEGELAVSPAHQALDGSAVTRVDDTLWSGELIYQWSQELEADYYATGFYMDLLRYDEPATRRAFRWFPLLLLGDLELYGYLTRLLRDPGAPPLWNNTEETDSELRRRLQRLPAAPDTDDFAEVLLDLELANEGAETHPPEHVRMEVVTFALLRYRAITPAEYQSPSPASAWRWVLRTLYNDFASELRAMAAP